MDEQVQPRGLSAAEVEERVARGEVNVDAGVHTRVQGLDPAVQHLR